MNVVENILVILLKIISGLYSKKMKRGNEILFFPKQTFIKVRLDTETLLITLSLLDTNAFVRDGNILSTIFISK